VLDKAQAASRAGFFCGEINAKRLFQREETAARDASAAGKQPHIYSARFRATPSLVSL